MDEEFSNDVDAGTETYSLAEDVLREPSASDYDAPPQSWKREVAERHWSKLDPELRGYLHSREKESGGKISELGRRASELEGVSSRYQPIDSLFERYRPHIPEGLEPAQAIEALLDVQRLISTPETREQAFAQLIQSCGVNPMALLPPQMREQFETAQSQLHMTREAESLKEFNAYAEGKPYIQEIMPDIAAEMRTLRQQAPGLDGKTILRLAHDNVVERNGMRARLDEEAKAEQEGRTAQAQAERLKEMQERERARREEEAKRVKAARRAAGINVKSSPGQSRAPKTLDDDLRAIAHRVYGA